jgi:hypothetical protein
MSEAAIKAEREQLAATIKALGESSGSLTSKVDTLEERVRSLSQAQSAAKLADLKNSEGPASEASYYTRCFTEDEVRAKPAAFVKSDAGVVQLFGFAKNEETPVRYGYLDDPNPRDEAQREFQITYSRAMLAKRIKSQDSSLRQFHNGAEPSTTPFLDDKIMRAAAACPGVISKIFASSTGIGLAMMPVNTAPEVERGLRTANNVSSMFAARVHHGSGPVRQVIAGGAMQAFARQIPTGDGPANNTLSSVTSTEENILLTESVVATEIDRNASEDALFDAMGVLNMEAVEALAFADDNTNMNGTLNGTTPDTIAAWNVRGRMATVGNTVTNQLRRWQGLRARAIAVAASAGVVDLVAAQTTAGIMSVVARLQIEQLMGQHGKSNVVILVNPEWWIAKGQFLTEFFTWQNSGQFAANVTGKTGDVSAADQSLPGLVGYLLGQFPVCLCFTLTRDLAATGLFIGTGATTSLVVVDRTRYEQWYAPVVGVDSMLDVRNGTITVAYRRRNVFRARTLYPGQLVAAYGFGLT